MYRLHCLYLVLVLGVLLKSSASEVKSEDRFGLRYGPRQARREEAEINKTQFSPIQQAQSAQNAEYTQHKNRLEGKTNHDSATDESASYSTMVFHDSPIQEMNQQYQPHKKPVKSQSKARRQNVRDNDLAYRSQKITKQADPPPPTIQNQTPVTPTREDPFVHSVHPSIMQTLLSQQPQTFDVPQDKETEVEKQYSSNWQTQKDIATSSLGKGLNTFQGDFNIPAAQQGNFDASKSPIYVPNRVSVQNPSSDSSFNVGYSIGFGNGLVQPPRVGIVQPPVGYRQGKEISYSGPYQATQPNVHIDGKNSVWKSMGPGVEVSYNIDNKFEVPKFHGNTGGKENNGYQAGSVFHQPIFYRDGFDNSFSSVPTSGRNSFDHNHALQQSNSFDFSNAIDPKNNLPYTTEEKSVQFSTQLQPTYQPTYSESSPKQPVTSFSESVSSQSPFSEPSSKHPFQSFVESQFKEQQNTHAAPQYTQVLLSKSVNKLKNENSKYETPKHEKNHFAFDTYSSNRSPNSISLYPKPKAIDFPKTAPGPAKSSYYLKTPINSDFSHMGDDLYGHGFGLPGLSGFPQMYSPTVKHPPGGIVQTILVPVNTPPPSYSYPIGMPLMSDGYSPYLGHPVGMLRIPDHMGPYNFHKGELESFGGGQQYSSPQFQKTQTPLKLVHAHHAVVRHQKEHNSNPEEPYQDHQQVPLPHEGYEGLRDYQYSKNPLLQVQSEEVIDHRHVNAPLSHVRSEETSQYHHSKSPFSPMRSEDQGDQRHTAKFKRVFSTVAPAHSPSVVKTHPTSSLRGSFDVEPTTSPYPATSHLPRPYRSGSMIIVKRT